MGTDVAAPRFAGLRAGYESYYLRAAHPDGGLGFWLRYTARVAPGEHPVGSLWFTLFDGAAASPTASKLTAGPPRSGGPSGPWIEIAGATMGDGSAQGTIEAAPGRTAVSWDLSFTGEPPLAHLAHPWMYTGPLPRTKPVSLHPFARLSGTVAVDGRRLQVDSWPGMVGHNWGASHAERWIWLHGLRFDGHDDDTWLDVVLGRIKVGPVLLPWVASGALSLKGERHALGGIERLRSTRVSARADRAGIVLASADGITLRIEIGAPRQRFVGWAYADPDGTTHDVVNCSIADLDANVGRPGNPDLLLRARGTAAYELGMREHQHVVEIQPFTDA
jgi:hypothetical protein